MADKLSHILFDLDTYEKHLKEEALKFDPSCFSIKSKKERLKKVEENDFAFIKEYFPHLDVPFADCHDEWIKIYNRRNREIHQIQGPRRFAKSELLRCTRINKMLFKKIRHGYRVGETLPDAENEIAFCKLELELNARILYDFGHVLAKGKKSDSKIFLKNGVTFFPLASLIKARGLTPEPDYIEIDDLEDEESAANLDRGLKKMIWIIKELYGATSKDATITWLCNNLSLNSACNQFKDYVSEKPRSKFFAHVTRAIETDAEGKEYSTWEAYWSLQELYEWRDNIGTAAFEAEMQQNPLRPGDKFKFEWLQYVEQSEIERTKAERKVGIFLDPSYGETESSCYKAIIVITTDGKYFDVSDAWIRQSSVRAMCHAFFEIVRRWNGWAIMFAKFEDIMNQKTLMRDFTEVAEERGEPRFISGVGDSDVWFKTNKNVRIESLSMPLETGRIRFVRQNGKLSPDMARLIEQLMNYPSKPIDGPDALASCYKLLLRYAGTKSQTIYKSLGKRLRTWRDRHGR